MKAPNALNRCLKLILKISGGLLMAKLDLGLPRYMGRGIGYGFTSQGEPAVFYFAEGRSPPSRERKLWVPEGEGGQRVYMDVSSRTSIEEMVANGGNPDLLLYNAMYVSS